MQELGLVAKTPIILAITSILVILAHRPVSAQPPTSTTAETSPPGSVASTSREAQLEERLHKLEAMNQKILQQYEAMDRKHNERYEALSKEVVTLRQRMPTPVAPPPASWWTLDGGDEDEQVPDDRIPFGPEGTMGRGSAGDQERPGGGAGGVEGNRAGAYPYASPDPTRTGGDTTRGGGPARGPQGTIGRRGKEGESRPIKTTIGNGLRFDSADEEFQLQFHNLTQAELRTFPGLGDQSPLHTQFFIPRQRWYFTGRATKNVEFYTVINRGYGALDVLDAFLNFNFDPRIQFRAGRTKTPTSYEYYQIAEGDLIAPERSLFVGNLSGNRQDGFMFHGQIQEKRAEWAAGVFNGPRRSFTDFNNDKDLYLFYNVRPFQKSESLTALKYFNVGGSYNFGTQYNPLQPNILTTANDETALSNDPVVQSLSPTFFKFNSNVMENGGRAQWAGWIMWFYKSFNILAEYDGGFQDYTFTNKSNRTHVPLEGFSTTAFYFLTGEEITRRVDVQPNRDFGIKNGKITGPGAIELFARYSYLNIGTDVFTAGLADHNLWTNQAYAVDTGINWYLNRYTKIYLDWQHAGFGNPVTNGPGSFIRSTNLLWLRFQLFF